MDKLRTLLSKATPYLFLLPALVFFGVFVLFPMLWSFRLSFFNWRVVSEQFTGLQNYANVLADPIFYVALANTLLYVVTTVGGQVILGLFFAFLLNQRIRGRTIFRVMYYIPVITSWAVVAILWAMLLDPTKYGFLNYALMSFGITGSPIHWLTEPWLARISIIMFSIWKGLGWTTIMFLGALQSIPQKVYEVADLDNATTWRKFRSITLPLMSPVVAVVAAQLIIGAFNIFPQVYILTGGGPLHSTESLTTWQFSNAFTKLDFGYATAMGFLLLPFILIMTLIQMRLVRREFEY
jgi:ABC-type sugar transport system permease subunit